MTTRKDFLTALMAAAASGGCSSAPWPGGDAKPAALKVLMIGNSFSICALRETPNVAKAAGVTLDLASLYIGGCTLDRHWKNCENTAPDFRPYQVSCSWASGPKPAFPGKANVDELLAAQKWDVVTLQQGSHQSWRPESYEPYLANLAARVKKLAPQAEIVLQETWSYVPLDGRMAKWGLDQKSMYAKLHAAYYAAAKRYGWRVIPTGTAVQLFRERLPVVYKPDSLGGDVCGLDKFEKQADGTFKHKGDVAHLNANGDYLQGLVWTAKLFGLDARTLAYAPKRLAGKKDYVDCLRACAAAAIAGEVPKCAANL